MISTFKLLTVLPFIWGSIGGNYSIVPPAPSQFQFGEVSIGPGTSVESYYSRPQTLANPTQYPATGRGVLVFFGQSNLSNVNPTTYVPVNSTVFIFSVVDGSIYTNSSPTIGTSTSSAVAGIGCTAIRIADTLITNGNFTSVIVVDSAIGGTTVSPYWSSDSLGMIRVTFAQLTAQGLTPNAVIYGQGESDTGAGTSQAAYTSGLASFISNVRTAGYVGPIFVAHESWNLGSTSSNVTNAQDAAVNHSSGIWAGPNSDTLGSGDRQSDNTHFNDTGAPLYAGLWITALHAFGAPF